MVTLSDALIFPARTHCPLEAFTSTFLLIFIPSVVVEINCALPEIVEVPVPAIVIFLHLI